MEQDEILEQEEMLEGDRRDCQPLHLQLQVNGGDQWLIPRYRIIGVDDRPTMAEKHVRELIPGEDDQSVYEIFTPLTQNGNGGEQKTLLYPRQSTSAVWRRAWQRRKLEDANHLTLSAVELHQRVCWRHQ